jgi:hypothetical protein
MCLIVDTCVCSELQRAPTSTTHSGTISCQNELICGINQGFIHCVCMSAEDLHTHTCSTFQHTISYTHTHTHTHTHTLALGRHGCQELGGRATNQGGNMGVHAYEYIYVCVRVAIHTYIYIYVCEVYVPLCNATYSAVDTYARTHTYRCTRHRTTGERDWRCGFWTAPWIRCSPQRYVCVCVFVCVSTYDPHIQTFKHTHTAHAHRRRCVWDAQRLQGLRSGSGCV